MYIQLLWCNKQLLNWFGVGNPPQCKSEECMYVQEPEEYILTGRFT
jgi:hypothetical protein